MKIVKNIVKIVLTFCVALILISAVSFTVHKGEFVIVKQFGKVVSIHEEPGLKFKAPFIQTVETLPNKVLIHDLPISEAITKDKQTLITDSFALWKITDPKKFITNLNGSMTNATARIEVAVYNATKTQISSRTQSEVITDRSGKLAADISNTAKQSFAQYGIELLSVETKHLDLPDENKDAVYNRMISERNNISATHKAEGEKEAAIIIAEADAEAESLRAEGEAEYMKILSKAYNNASKAEFYEFVRSLDAAKQSLIGSGENVLVLDKDSPLVDVFYMTLE